MKEIYKIKVVEFFCIMFVFCSFILTGCDNKTSIERNHILKIGVMAGPEAQLMHLAVEIMKQESQIEAQVIEFTDYISPNSALAEHEIDVNLFQHNPYLQSVIADRGYPLVVVAKMFLYPMGGYSRKIKKLEQLTAGAKVALPNDPTNGARALLLLHHSGLIELKNIDKQNISIMDIHKNIYDLQFLELDAAQLPVVIDDVELVFATSTFAAGIGLFPNKNALLREEVGSDYVNVMVARKGNEKDDRIQGLVRAFQSELVKKHAEELFMGGAIPGWE